MISRRILVILLMLVLVAPLSAQRRKAVKGTTTRRSTTTTAVGADRKSQLQSEQAAAARARQQSQAQLAQLNRSVKASLDSVLILDNQIGKQQANIDTLRGSIVAIEGSIARLNDELGALQDDLEMRRARYARALVMARRVRSAQSKLMFVLSARNFSQLARRVRYMAEYSTFQKAQGELLKEKQAEVRSKQNELLAAKTEKESMVLQVEATKQSLQGLKGRCQTQVAFLNRNIVAVQQEIKQYQAREAALNAEIDRIIQAELAAERKRKAEEARRAELARRKAAPSRKKGDAAAEVSDVAEEKGSAAKETWRSNDADIDTRLTGSFASNKGRLPIPITGSYNIVGHYGNYTVAGLRNVTLNNRGIDIRGQQGCQARAVFDGVVSKVVEYRDAHIVMVRHGAYISVYSGLASVSVHEGESVSTRQTLGTIGRNSDGNYVLQFQLRMESSSLNPEAWVR